MTNRKNKKLSRVECLETTGPWPFTTRRVYRAIGGPVSIWSSRHHRKALVLPQNAKTLAITEKLRRSFWLPRMLNWWIGVIFAVGSLFFALGSVLSLTPSLAAVWSLKSTEINALFFIGSIPFTIAAYLQLFQAANTGEFLKNHSTSMQRWRHIDWRPHVLGWHSCALQFVGTLLFNVNTFDAMIPSLTWFQQDLVIWTPNVVGSVLFLSSGYLAFIEACHAHWAWQPKRITWWVVFANLLGCVGFMVSAVFAISLPGTPNLEVVTISVSFTLMGAIGFLVSSLLMLPETISLPKT